MTPHDTPTLLRWLAAAPTAEHVARFLPPAVWGCVLVDGRRYLDDTIPARRDTNPTKPAM